ncbi:hypothetical protein SCOR_00300 [Sulfidibacter corallicola]|uniref:Chloramphenicol O-acetyltransferase type A n=1 Tax=Sulfidibacter corallicola TaxID=2818388 RepID=A0A8A4TIL9_SULCO|nr:CatA-like O-acetyltransferase [Sulfidibacter corallicola]QTD49034.1 hypothetical protein J3U87_25900 [Sulfidibacter corallicola]
MPFLDLEQWPRRDLFHFFRTFEYPFFGVCVRVRVGRLLAWARARQLKSFPCLLYGSQSAANGEPSFRYRLRGERVWVHDRIEAGFTVPDSPESFGFCHVPYHATFTGFYRDCRQRIEAFRKNPPPLTPSTTDDVIHYSVLPWLAFTGFSHARPGDLGDSVPKIMFGKIEGAEGEEEMPVHVSAHHALMDGVHVGRFIEAFQSILDRPELLDEDVPK